MAQELTEDDKNPANARLARQLQELREEFSKFREHANGQLKGALDELSKVSAALAIASKAATDAGVQATAATTAAQAATDRIKDAETDAKAAANKAAAAETRAETAETLVKSVKTEATRTEAKLLGLQKALGNDPGMAPPANGKLPPFLTVPLRDTEFDPVCQSAINDVLASRKADVTRLAGDIVAKGIASAIGKVSMSLGRSRISECRRSILAAAYPDLLKSRLGDPIQVDLAKDPPGLVQSLLLDLEAPGGPLDTFAERVVAGSEASLSLNLKNHERLALKARVRESL